MDDFLFLKQFLDSVPFLKTSFVVLGCVVVIAQVVVALTPTKKDDAAWDKIHSIPLLGKFLDALTKFAPLQKK